MSNQADTAFKLNLGVIFEHIKRASDNATPPMKTPVRRYAQNLSGQHSFMAPSESCSHDKTDKKLKIDGEKFISKLQV